MSKLTIGDKLRAIQSHPMVKERRAHLVAMIQLSKSPNMRFVKGGGSFWCELQRKGETRWIFEDGLNPLESSFIFSIMGL